jgi:hypothetical protein
LGHGNFTASTGNAVHAGIAAADALSAARSGTTWSGEHGKAPVHLEGVGGRDGKQAAQYLWRLIPLENRAEYDPRPVSATDARAAHSAARRIVTLAENAVDASRST